MILQTVCATETLPCVDILLRDMAMAGDESAATTAIVPASPAVVFADGLAVSPARPPNRSSDEDEDEDEDDEEDEDDDDDDDEGGEDDEEEDEDDEDENDEDEDDDEDDEGSDEDDDEDENAPPGRRR